MNTSTDKSTHAPNLQVNLNNQLQTVVNKQLLINLITIIILLCSVVLLGIQLQQIRQFKNSLNQTYTNPSPQEQVDDLLNGVKKYHFPPLIANLTFPIISLTAVILASLFILGNIYYLFTCKKNKPIKYSKFNFLIKIMIILIPVILLLIAFIFLQIQINQLNKFETNVNDVVAGRNKDGVAEIAGATILQLNYNLPSIPTFKFNITKIIAVVVMAIIAKLIIIMYLIYFCEKKDLYYLNKQQKS